MVVSNQSTARSPWGAQGANYSLRQMSYRMQKRLKSSVIAFLADGAELMLFSAFTVLAV
jgi:hypothetical protein